MVYQDVQQDSELHQAMIPEFHYRVPWRSHRAHPGHHKSAQAGGGFEFHGHAPLLSYPEPRHLDVRATLHDPFGQYMVRTFRQRSTVPVYVIADLSASMAFQNKMKRLATFAASVAYSAYRTGDPFSFIGGDSQLRWELLFPLRWYKGIAPELHDRLYAFEPTGRSATGLTRAAQYMGSQKALVFLASDFHFPLADLSVLLDTLIHHDVVPVVLWDSLEYQRLPSWGFTRLKDMETGEEHRLLMRPALRRRFAERFAQRRLELTHLFMDHGREPFFLVDDFEADALTRYFYQS
jgi:uncharacterized protein (DUF58 family)